MAPSPRVQEIRRKLARRRRALERHTLVVLALGAALSIVIQVAPDSWWTVAVIAAAYALYELTAVGRRCDACGRRATLARVGRRRSGYLRLRCRACGAERTGTIEDAS